MRTSSHTTYDVKRDTLSSPRELPGAPTVLRLVREAGESWGPQLGAHSGP